MTTDDRRAGRENMKMMIGQTGDQRPAVPVDDHLVRAQSPSNLRDAAICDPHIDEIAVKRDRP